MSDRFPGGVISKTPPTVTPPTGGEGGSASGIWTLDEVLGYQKAGAWPQGLLPRELYAWGQNHRGQLGLGDTVNRSSPTVVGDIQTWSSTATWLGSFGITNQGNLYAWGYNSKAVLGLNDKISRSSPTQVGALTNWSFVSPGEEHTMAVKTDNTLWAWGDNGNGELGTNNTIDRSSPVQVGSDTNWATVAGGKQFTLAVRTTGTLWSWGKNSNGALGLNLPGTALRSSPVQVGSLSNWSTVSARNDKAGAIKTDDTLWTWGFNQSGELGLNDTYRRSSPVQVGGSWSSVSFSTGQLGPSFGVKTNGTIWFWGDNFYGESGTGAPGDASSPIQIGALTDWSFVEASYRGAVALKTDESLWAWGTNDTGQVGDDTTIGRSSPVQVDSGVAWTDIGVGPRSVLATSRG